MSWHYLAFKLAFSDIKQKYNFIHYILPLVLKYLTKDIGRHLTSIWFALQLRPKALGSAPDITVHRIDSPLFHHLAYYRVTVRYSVNHLLFAR